MGEEKEGKDSWKTKSPKWTSFCRNLGRTWGFGEGSSQKTGFGKAQGTAKTPRRSLRWPILTNTAHDEEFAEEEEEIGDFIQDGHPGREREVSACSQRIFGCLFLSRRDLDTGNSGRTSPDDVPHQQEEGVPGGGAEVGAVNSNLGGVTETGAER